MSFFMNLASLMWNIGKNNQNEDLQKNKKGPIICTVENEIPKCQTGYMQNSFQVGP